MGGHADIGCEAVPEAVRGGLLAVRRPDGAHVSGQEEHRRGAWRGQLYVGLACPGSSVPSRTGKLSTSAK
jgi:hypothetical protein